MKANELRIGNYVGTHNEGEENRIFIVNTENIRTELKANKQGYSRYRDIPLTEEWLKRFGFEVNHRNVVLSNPDRTHVEIDAYIEVGEFRICYEYRGKASHRDYSQTDTERYYIAGNGGYEYGGEYPLNIKSVHQLQNLYFALTGEELTIKE